MQEFFRKAVKQYAVVHPSQDADCASGETNVRSEDLQMALLKVLGHKVKPQLDEFDLASAMRKLNLDVSLASFEGSTYGFCVAGFIPYRLLAVKQRCAGVGHHASQGKQSVCS